MKQDTDIVKDFAYFGSVTNSNGDCRQEIRRGLRPRQAAVEELGKTPESKAVSLETTVSKIIHTLVFTRWYSQ